MLRDFDLAFDYMIKNEGGIKLHTVKGDPGGTTFAGIAFNRWPKHSIWAYIKRLEVKEGEEVEYKTLINLVKKFYFRHFWSEMKCYSIASYDPLLASSLFDFGVNVGTCNAVKVLQGVLGVKEDGIIGPNTLKGVERFADQARTYDEAATRDTFTIAKVEYYTNLCNKNKNLNKFLKGWLNRTLRSYHEL